jgi:hypothetical protein
LLLRIPLLTENLEALEAAGWSSTVSDLYAMSFDPCGRREHFPMPLESSRFDVQSERRHASKICTLPAHVDQELARMRLTSDSVTLGSTHRFRGFDGLALAYRCEIRAVINDWRKMRGPTARS